MADSSPKPVQEAKTEPPSMKNIEHESYVGREPVAVLEPSTSFTAPSARERGITYSFDGVIPDPVPQTISAVYTGHLQRVNEDGGDSVSIESDDEEEAQSSRYRRLQSRPLQRGLFPTQWPKKTGASLAAVGFLSFILGICEVVILPVVENPERSLEAIELCKRNCFGLPLWTGALLILTGASGIRAARNEEAFSVYLFFVLVCFSVMTHTGGVILIIVGYAWAWTTASAYPNGSVLYGLHFGTSGSVALGLLFTILAFTKYYEDIFCGELQLCKRCVHCFLPCWCPKSPTVEELIEETPQIRPPSLPV